MANQGSCRKVNKRPRSGGDRRLTVFVHQNRPELGSLDVAEVCLKIKERQMLECVKDKQSTYLILQTKTTFNHKGHQADNVDKSVDKVFVGDANRGYPFHIRSLFLC